MAARIHFLLLFCLFSVGATTVTLSKDQQTLIAEASGRIKKYFLSNFGFDDPRKLFVDAPTELEDEADRTTALCAAITGRITSVAEKDIRSALMKQLKSIRDEKKEDSVPRYRIHFFMGLLEKAKPATKEDFKKLVDGYPESSKNKDSDKGKIEAILLGIMVQFSKVSGELVVKKNILKSISQTASVEDKLTSMKDAERLAANLLSTGVTAEAVSEAHPDDTTRLITQACLKIVAYFWINFGIKNPAVLLEQSTAQTTLESVLQELAKRQDKNFPLLKSQLESIQKEEKTGVRYRIHFFMGLLAGIAAELKAIGELEAAEKEVVELKAAQQKYPNLEGSKLEPAQKRVLNLKAAQEEVVKQELLKQATTKKLGDAEQELEAAKLEAAKPAQREVLEQLEAAKLEAAQRNVLELQAEAIKIAAELESAKKALELKELEYAKQKVENLTIKVTRATKWSAALGSLVSGLPQVDEKRIESTLEEIKQKLQSVSIGGNAVHDDTKIEVLKAISQTTLSPDPVSLMKRDLELAKTKILIEDACDRIASYFETNFHYRNLVELLELKNDELPRKEPTEVSEKPAFYVAACVHPLFEMYRFDREERFDLLKEQLEFITNEAKSKDSSPRYRIHFFMGLLAKAASKEKLRIAIDNFPTGHYKTQISKVLGELKQGLDRVEKSQQEESVSEVLKEISATAWDENPAKMLKQMKSLSLPKSAASLDKDTKKACGIVATYFREKFDLTNSATLLDSSTDVTTLESVLMKFAKDQKKFKLLKGQLKHIQKASSKTGMRYRIHFFMGLLEVADEVSMEALEKMIDTFPEQRDKNQIEENISEIAEQISQRSTRTARLGRAEQILVLKIISATAWDSSSDSRLAHLKALNLLLDLSESTRVDQLRLMLENMQLKRTLGSVDSHAVMVAAVSAVGVANLEHQLLNNYGFSVDELPTATSPATSRGQELTNILAEAKQTQARELVSFSNESIWGHLKGSFFEKMKSFLKDTYRPQFRILKSGDHNNLSILIDAFMENSRVRRERVLESLERVKKALVSEVLQQTTKCAKTCLDDYKNKVTDEFKDVVLDIVDPDSGREVKDIVSVWTEKLQMREKNGSGFLGVAILGADTKYSDFNLRVGNYFQIHFRTAGYNYLRLIMGPTNSAQMLEMIGQPQHGKLQKLLDKCAKYTVAKFTERRWFGLRDKKEETQISFRLHRVIGALEYKVQKEKSGAGGGSITEVLTGAMGSKFWVPTLAVKVITDISSLPDRRIKFGLLQLVGKIALSSKSKPPFYDKLFEYAGLIVLESEKPSDISRFGIESLLRFSIAEINASVQGSTSIKKLEAAVHRILSEHVHHLKRMLPVVARVTGFIDKQDCRGDSWRIFEIQVQRMMEYFLRNDIGRPFAVNIESVACKPSSSTAVVDPNAQVDPVDQFLGIILCVETPSTEPKQCPKWGEVASNLEALLPHPPVK